MSHGYLGTRLVQRLTTSSQNTKLDVFLLNKLIALSNLYFKNHLKIIEFIQDKMCGSGLTCKTSTFRETL